MTSTSSKIKFLVCGAVQGKISEFHNKLETLQSSKAGPFDMCLCVGPFSEENDIETLQSMEFAVPVYVLELGNTVVKSSVLEKEGAVVGIGKNIYYLRGSEENGCADITKLPLDCEYGLDVAWMPSFARMDHETTSLLESKMTKEGYIGCDVLLTSEWGQGLANSNVLGEKVMEESKEEIGCYDVTKIATLTKPRYHFAPSLSNGRHIASSPFLTAPNSPPCRFIALSKFSTNKDPKFKSLHAINLAPLRNTEIDTATSQLPSPYTTITEIKPIPSFEPDPNACLFLYGLAKCNLTSGDLLQAFQQYGCKKIHIPPNGKPSYAFLYFPSHTLANDCLNLLNGQITISGTSLSLKWRTVKRDRDTPQDQNKRRKVTEAEASESTQVYIRLRTNTNLEESFEQIRALLQTILENAINEGNTEMITAEKEPALIVTLRLTSNNYAFCNFASHAAASMAIATVTHSIDGGVIDEKFIQDQPHLTGTMIYWANNQPNPTNKPTIDSCWFCLSNPKVIQHLIISKHENCYITIPRGPVTTYHTLIVPNEHHSKGIFALPPQTINPILSMKRKLQQYYKTNTNQSLFIYERAFETRRGLHHSHFQCIPIPNALVSELDVTIQKLAAPLGFDFEAVTDEELIQRDLSSYFYIDLPVVVDNDKPDYKQLVYVPKEDGNVRSPPLQFGREIIASLLGSPVLSDWSVCAMSEEKEKEIASGYREMLKGVFDVDDGK